MEQRNSFVNQQNFVCAMALQALTLVLWTDCSQQRLSINTRSWNKLYCWV